MSKPDDTGPDHLADYGLLLRRRWRIVAAGLLLGAVVGFVTMRVVPPTYEATTNVLVLPTGVPGTTGNVAGGRTQDAINLDTEAQLVTSASVSNPAGELMHSRETGADLAERVEITVPPNSAVLSITYSDNTPAKAARGARAFAKSYLTNRKATAERQADQRAESLDRQRGRLQKKLKRLNEDIATLPEGTERDLAGAEKRSLTSQISDLGEKLTPLQDPSVDPGRVITDAAPPTEPSQPVPILFLVSGAALGLLAGLFLAVLRDKNDHRIRDARDVTSLLDLPVLADIELPEGTSVWTNLLPSKSGAAQEIRQLQHVITGGAGARRTVLVTSASIGPATQLLAANLTASLARSGKQVIHVCADFGSEAGTRMLGLRNAPGLAEVLLESRPVDTVTQVAPGNARIHLLAPGLRTGDAGDLPNDRLSMLVGLLANRYDHVVIEAPTTTVTADAQAWAQHSDVAVLAVQRLHTLREDALDAVNQMELVGCEVLGLVVLPRHKKNDDHSVPPERYPHSSTHPVAAPPSQHRAQRRAAQPPTQPQQPAVDEPEQQPVMRDAGRSG
ncbi:MAG: hypothetical protein GEV07_10125 [Streptosporangiales bacterium]|nr:hypothetical protein [Streptosporangiales bacterium]